MNLESLPHIQIEQSRTSTLPRVPGTVEKTQVSLGQKIEEYNFLLGGSPTHVLGVLVQLLSVGKVRLDFREYNERLELVNKHDAISRAEAVPLVEAYLAALKAGETTAAADFTQKIIIQAPKRTVV
jgi:hypothetical protein